ncbi:MAG: hypothetical protein J5533_05160 [Bacteroidales bacterium]|nr:hypothetical protein [Bacteroidales bacterium]
MKYPVLAFAAALACCVSCVDIDPEMGANLIPVDQTYTINLAQSALPAGSIYTSLTDSLSGYSQSRITIGALRDEDFGLTSRSCVLTLVPSKPNLDFGNVSAAKILGFHFAAALDSVSVASFDQAPIIQQVRVHSLAEPVNPGRDYNCLGNSIKVDRSKSVVKGIPTINGSDSLSFDFTEEYARRILSLTEDDYSSFQKYTEKIPGIHISTDAPAGLGGRINIFDLQVGYSKNSGYVTGNFARLSMRCDYDKDGKAEKDTAFNFVFGLADFTNIDSLFSAVKRGEYPEYALNLTEHESRSMSGPVTETIPIEGGGGLKPVISALSLKHLAEDLIRAKGGDPATAVINKASLIFPFPFPDDYRQMFKFPQVLTPVCRIRQSDTLVTFAGLTDASASDENQGEINRSTLVYEPDITYHMQELLKISETADGTELENLRTRRLLSGEYDIWFIITAHETVTTETGTSDLSDYYQMLAYQNYYNNMYYGGYGGYGYGYGGYGYGGYGGYGYNSYSNYYNMMMYASLYGSSSSSTSTTDQLDKDRYYCGTLYGPTYPDASLRPRLELTFSIPNSE